MKQKIILTTIGLLTVVFAGYSAFSAGSGKKPSTYNTPIASTESAPLKSYTLAEIAMHKDASSCWTTVNGGVYDVTSWASQHPGGEGAILFMCGNDASSAFNDQHGGQRRPEKELASFKIGNLSK